MALRLLGLCMAEPGKLVLANQWRPGKRVSTPGLYSVILPEKG